MLKIQIPKNPTILRRVKKTEIYNHAKKSINEIQVPQQKKFFKIALNKPYYTLIGNNYNKLENYVSYLYEVIQKLKMCTDKTAISELNRCIAEIFKDRESNVSTAFMINTVVEFMENILDKPNVESNKYTTLYPKHSTYLNQIKDIKNLDSYKLLNKNILEIKDTVLKKIIEKARNTSYYTFEENAKEILTTLNDFLIKYKSCKDSTIKKHIYKSITSTIDKSPQETYDSIIKNNLLLDAVNIADSKYSPLYSYQHNIDQHYDLYHILLKYLKNDISKKNTEEIKNHKEEISRYLSKKRKGYKIFNESKNELKSFNDKHFEKYSNFEYIKNFINNNPDEKSINQYLWNKYFISKLTKNNKNNSKSNEIVHLLNAIEKEYGTRIFFDKKYPDIIKLLNCLQTGLANMKQSGNEIPKIIDITSYNKEIIKKLDIYGDLDGKYIQFS